MNKTKYEFSITGFLIAILLISMMAGVFGVFISSLEEEYSFSSELSGEFNAFNKSSQITQNIEELEAKTKIKPQTGIVDIIGGFFSSGYSALQITFNSFGLFTDITESASNTDIMGLSYFKVYLINIVLIGLIVGVIISVLLKMRI